MKAEFHKDFDKQLGRLPEKQREKAIDVIASFLDDPTAVSLRNHALIGQWAGYRSISAGGDLRLHFQMVDADTAYFVAIGTHSQLYR
jgi:addiction module RelE/StbE family toxin